MPDAKDTSEPGWFSRWKTRYAEHAASSDVQKARRLSIIAISIGVLLVGGYRLLSRPDRNAVSFTAGVMPACDATPTRRLLKQAIDGSASAKDGTAVLQRIGTIQETGFVPVGAKGTEVRLCQADVFFNVGRHDMPFTLEWTSPAKNELWIEAEAPF